MKTSATNRRLRSLLTDIGKEKLLPQPEFQRKLVWTNKDKSAFIKTVLEGYPFPEVYIASGEVDPETGEGTELLVDGQQRLTTLYQYFKASGDLKLSKGIPAYSTLSREQQIDFLEYEVVVRDLGNKNISVIKDIFERINSTNYGLNAMEIHNARYGGEFKKFCEAVAQDTFFERHRLFSASEIRRMNDVKYCIVLIITIMSNYFNRDSEVESYLERYNEDFADKDNVWREIDGVLRFIDEVDLPNNSRAFKKADFFTLFVELHRALFKKVSTPSAVVLKENLLAFYRDVENAGDQQAEEEGAGRDYYKAALQATNDRSSRILRGKIIEEIINSSV